MNRQHFYSLIVQRAQQQAEQTFLTVNNDSMNWQQACQSATQLAHGLQVDGIGYGDQVILLMPNCLQWYQLFLALNAIGAIPVPLDPQIGCWELGNILSNIEVKACVTCKQFRAINHLDNLAQLSKAPELIYCLEPSEYSKCITDLYNETSAALRPQANEVLMLAATSGTTGNAKIVRVEQRGFIAAQQHMADYLAIAPKDTMLLGMPLFHQGGFGMGMQALLNGASLTYQAQLAPAEFLECISQQGISLVQLTPTVAKLLVSLPSFQDSDFSTLRLAYFAGETLSQTLAEVFSCQLQIPVLNIIGSTETGTMVAWDSRFSDSQDPNNFQPLPFSQVQIIDDKRQPVQPGDIGEMLVHTDCVLLDYVNNPAESAARIIIDAQQRRWFRTGDLARQQANGQVQFIGRAKRALKRGANLIHPEELELFFSSHPDIIDVAVIGQSDALLGQRVMAYIIEKQPPRLTAGTLRRYCLGQVAAYKVPDEFHFVAQLPNNKGKNDIRALADSAGLAKELL